MNGRKLYLQIADKISRMIENGEYRPGARLPPERDLAQALGVSRPSVREALIALEINGSVNIKMGSGVYVCSPSKKPEKPAPSLGESPTELMQARAVLEGGAAALACARSTPKVISRLYKILESMRAELAAGRSVLTHDRDFHVSIASMTGNSVIVRLTEELFNERHMPLSTQFSLLSETLESWEQALVEHEAIIKAFEARDPLGAQTAMRAHLKMSEERWLLVGAKSWA